MTAPPAIPPLLLRASGQRLEVAWAPVFALPPPSPRVLDHRPAASRLTLQYREGSPPDARETAAALVPFLGREAAKLFPARLRELAALHGFPAPPRVRIGLTYTRWASRSSNGTISCSVMMMFLPPALLDHVLLHELCHVEHMDHGAAFHARLRQADPQSATHSAALRSADRDYIPRWLLKFR